MEPRELIPGLSDRESGTVCDRRIAFVTVP